MNEMPTPYISFMNDPLLTGDLLMTKQTNFYGKYHIQKSILTGH
jgi:hypothetical protein